VNTASGGGHSPARLEHLRQQLRDSGIEVEIVTGGSGKEIAALAGNAMRARTPVILVAGGDGTVGTIAGVLQSTETALGVIPLGTLNHFAKDLRIPMETAAAVRTIAEDHRVRVDVGDVNGTSFVNNSSLGLYPDIVRERERRQRRLKASKRSAMLWAILAAMRRSPLLHLRLRLDDGERECRSPFVFVGNNRYTMQGFNIGTRSQLDCGVLSLYTTQRCTARNASPKRPRAVQRWVV
jgi:diacylglycerol kinase family enzyme